MQKSYNDIDIETKLDQLNQKINDVYVSVEKTRKYFLIIVWITVIAFVLPLVGMLFIVPDFLNTYLGSLDGLI